MPIDEKLPIEPSLPPDELMSIGGDEFSVAFGESLANTLDLHTWQPGENLANLYGRLEQEIEQAVEQENVSEIASAAKYFLGFRRERAHQREPGYVQRITA